MTEIKSLLIANRGEPVRRAIKTLKKLGIEAMVIYTPEDKNKPWVAEACKAFPISNYLNGPEIIETAKRESADAVWPGWGFLSERAEFAGEVISAGIRWIGPTPESITVMGSKADSARIAEEAGLKNIPQAELAMDKDIQKVVSRANEAVQKIGYPVLIKPALGGGGQGQAVAHNQEELVKAIDEILPINISQFGGGPLIMQRYLGSAKHIEAQLLSDNHGNIVILGHRECSVQRRNQKIIEEAPSPAIDVTLSDKIIEYSRSLVKAINYQSAGTIEFLLSDGELFFLEMNTRLQVEHPVTEETVKISTHKKGERIDFLTEMIRIAEGKPIGFTQDDVSCVGHAIETRIYAEDPSDGFRPSPGRIHMIKFPEPGAGKRIDASLATVQTDVSTSYDPMIAKLICWGPDRDTAITRLRESLLEMMILGPTTNLMFLDRITYSPSFIDGSYDTGLLRSEEFSRLKEDNEYLGLALALAAAVRYKRDLKSILENPSKKITSLAGIIASVPANGQKYVLEYNDRQAEVFAGEFSPNNYFVRYEGEEISFELAEIDDWTYMTRFRNGAVVRAGLIIDGSKSQIALMGKTYNIKISTDDNQDHLIDSHLAPFGGKIVSIGVTEGMEVKPDTELYRIEAMKMVTIVRASASGKVTQIHKAAGDAIGTGDRVLSIEDQADGSQSINQNRFQPEELCWHHYSKIQNPAEIILNYFLGYDISSEAVNEAITDMTKALKNKKYSKEEAERLLSKILKKYRTILKLFSDEHAHMMSYLAENLGDKSLESKIPTETLGYLKTITACRDLNRCPIILIKIFQAWKNDFDLKVELLSRLVRDWVQINDLRSKTLIDELAEWITDPPNSVANLIDEMKNVIRKVDRRRYYSLVHPPVSLDYLEKYELYKANPTTGISNEEIESLQQKLISPFDAFKSAVSGFSGFLSFISDLLGKWFNNFYVREIPVPKPSTDAYVRLFELVAKENANEENESSSRLVAVAAPPSAELVKNNEGMITVPSMETAAIEAYRCLRLAEGWGSRHRLNHVFLFAPENMILRKKDTEKKSLTVNAIRSIASRVAGFARGIRVRATEIIVNMEMDGETNLSVLEIRHADTSGVFSRPPFRVTERRSEESMDPEAIGNDRQNRLGKLLNSDRAKLLFDGGVYEELLFPEADEKGGVGLNVYRGRVDGRPALAYAGDFRLRGGALGEREGKKLAATVILAYLSGSVLFGIHDGAGANIKESVASLGWAGAYFGAIAVTGGLSTPEKFIHWLNNHHEYNYFKKVLHHFGYNESTEELIKTLSGPLKHIHLHLGASVGMLVYGSAISHCSIMVDQPQAYRVLTGAETVKRVLGEHSTNYKLGGAEAHSRKSGDIDFVAATEEAAIEKARSLMNLFSGKSLSEGKIKRDTTLPVLNIPDEGGIIITRDAVRSHVDDGIFYETRQKLEGAGGVITGFARIGSRPVAIIATATDYGLGHHSAFKKATLMMEAAQDFRLPLVIMVGSHWEAITETSSADDLYRSHEMQRILGKVTTPVISLALGHNSLEQGIHGYSDLVCYVSRVGRPSGDLLRAGKMSHKIADSLTDAMNWVASALKYLPGSPSENLLHENQADSSRRASKNLAEILPRDLKSAYDVRLVIGALFDQGSFLELFASDKQPLVTGLATLGGNVVGIIADDPQVEGGAQTYESIRKFTRHNSLLEKFHIPLVQLSDSPAFRPGGQQEHGGIQTEGGKSIRDECLSKNPKIAVTLRQNYGGRFIHANLNTLGPPRAGLVAEGARIGVMGAEGAVGILFGKKLNSMRTEEQMIEKKKLVTEYESMQLDSGNAVKLGYVEGPVPLNNLREEIHKTLLKLIK